MSTSLANSASRQTLVLASIAGMHLAAFVVISLGLRPSPAWVQAAPPIFLVEQKPPKQATPLPPGDVALPGDPSVPIPAPPLHLPDFGDDRDDPTALSVPAESQAGAAPDLTVSVATAPSLRLRSGRLSSVIDACYPSASRRLAEEGRVLVRLTIDADGRPAAWAVAQGSGFPKLDAAVACVVRRLEFAPGRRDGRAVQAQALLPIVFRMR